MGLWETVTRLILTLFRCDFIVCYSAACSGGQPAVVFVFFFFSCKNPLLILIMLAKKMSVDILETSVLLCTSGYSS